MRPGPGRFTTEATEFTQNGIRDSRLALGS